MDAILNLLVDYNLINISIGIVGLYGLALVYDRVKALYFDFSLPAEPFMKQVHKLVEEDKVEEAITFCGANEKKPLAYVVKRILERSDRDHKSIEHSLDIAASEVAPNLVRRLGQIAMVGNVVVLVGLFGTITGLIVAFKAISFADVTQKQTILAQGISIALTSTAAALVVAIPMMFIYSILHEKQGRLFSEIDQHSNKVIELLRERIYLPFRVDSAFPTNLNSDKFAKGEKAPPPPKASKPA